VNLTTNSIDHFFQINGQPPLLRNIRCAITLSISLINFAATPIHAAAAAETPESWFQNGTAELQKALQLKPNVGTAKNVILFVGDGMGISTVTAARIFDGQIKGGSGEENILSFEALPYVALSKTYNTNQQVPDSAGTMTAMMTGVKTKAGFIAVNQNAQGGNCASSKGQELKTFLEQAEEAGLSTGVVTTTRLTHATPAATYAHVPHRDWENDHNLTREAKEQGCKDIARQLIEFPYGDGLEVAMGGGRRGFLPRETDDIEDAGKKGEREDKRDLTQEWLAKYEKSAYVWNEAQFDKIDPAQTNHLLGLFNRSHMQYDEDRKQDPAGEPSLSAMTKKAIQILQKNNSGFFLMVEGGRIDHAHHAGNAHRALQDTREFANAVQTARELTNDQETLIIVTADHSHVFNIAGYPIRGNPILGKVVGNDELGNPSAESLALDGLPYTTLNYANGLGFAMLPVGGEARSDFPPATGRHDLSKVDTKDQGYHQEALVPLESETHSADDVAIYAGGPGAYLFHSTHEQHYIYHVMHYAAALDKRREP